MLVLHGYLWWRLVRGTTRPGRARRRLTLLTVVLTLLPSLAVTLRRTIPLHAAGPLDWVAYTWLGIAFYAFLTLLVLEPVRLSGTLWLGRHDNRVVPGGPPRGPRRRGEAASRDGGTAPVGVATRQDRDVTVPFPSRRLFLSRSLAVTAGAVALGTAGAGAFLANTAPVVRRGPIMLTGLDAALDGLRIVTFARGHLSAGFRGPRVRRGCGVGHPRRPGRRPHL